jgi:hypothetical protein
MTTPHLYLGEIRRCKEVQRSKMKIHDKRRKSEVHPSKPEKSLVDICHQTFQKTLAELRMGFYLLIQSFTVTITSFSPVLIKRNAISPICLGRASEALFHFHLKLPSRDTPAVLKTRDFSWFCKLCFKTTLQM